MNEFQRALAKTEKREARKTLTLPVITARDIAEQHEEKQPVAKEKKASNDGIIDVTITLPYETFQLRFVKQNITGMKRLSRRDFEKAITEGLRPILGGIK